MSRSSLYCEECGARLTLYVVGVCPQCDFDLTGRDDEREWRETIQRGTLQAPKSDPERTEP
jgi:hypothetical protein